MFWLIMKKELKSFFTNKGNLIFVFGLPFLMIALMSTALKDYMENNLETFKDGVVLYHQSNISKKATQYLKDFRMLLQESTDVELIEINDEEEGKQKVEASEAFSLISIKGNHFAYYRSPYNEPEGGKLIRGMFNEVIGRDIQSNPIEINTVLISKPRINSNAYFTFAELPFIMMYLALLIGHSVIDERSFGTIERIKISSMGIGTMRMSKVTTGLCAGVVQIATGYLLSNIFLDVHWGSMTPYMFLVLIGVTGFSSVLGVVMGMIVKTKMVADNFILMSVILMAFMGGIFSPIYIMENIKIIGLIMKISPLYWTNKALNSLYAGVLDQNTWICWIICLVLMAVLCVIYNRLSKKSNLVIQAS